MNPFDWFLWWSGVAFWLCGFAVIWCGLYWRWQDRKPRAPVEYRPRQSAKP